MKKILSVGLAALLLLSCMSCLPVFATEDAVAEPTFAYDFSAHCHPDDYGFENARDVAISGGTKGYYTFAAEEDELYVGLRPMVDLPAPRMPAKDMAYAVIMYRSEVSAEGAFLVAREDGKEPGMTGTRVSWTYVGDSEWHLALIDASTVWGNAFATVSRFRFDLFVNGTDEDVVDVSYIKFFASAEDAQSYVDANSTRVGGFTAIDATVEKDGVVYGYADKVEVTATDTRLVTEVLDWSLENVTQDSPNFNHHLMGQRVVTSWEAGGYINADRPMFAVHGQDGQYLKFNSLPFADYERVKVFLTSSGSAGNDQIPADDYPMIVGFVSDPTKLYGIDFNNPNLEANIVYGECLPATQGEENLSGMGIGSSWNLRERMVSMNITGVTHDGVAALYVASRSPHIPVVLKILFERDVEATLYVDEDGNEYVDGETLILEEDGTFYAYTGLFELISEEQEDGSVLYGLDLTEYFAEEPALPTPPTHTIKFVDEKGNVVAEYKFIEGATEVDWTEPEVPAKPGMEGYWEAYSLTSPTDLVVKAKYRLAPTVDTDPVESNTEAVTDVPTDTLADTETEAEELTTADAVVTTTANDEASSGCKSVVGGAAVLVLSVVALGAAVSSKKRED